MITGSNRLSNIIVGTGPGGAHGYGDATFDETRFYSRDLSDSEIKNLYYNIDGNTELNFADVKVTTDNPVEVQPFSTLYHTSSTAWNNWYEGMIDSASEFDRTNIHSCTCVNYISNYI